MIEFYKYLHSLAAPMEVFIKTVLKHNLQSYRANILPNPKTKKNSTDTVVYKAAQIWSIIPKRFKNLSSLNLFESQIKNWNCSDCPCNICQIFVAGEGFIN